MKWSLKNKSIFIISLLLFFALIIVGTVSHKVTQKTVEREVSERALSLANIISQNYQVREAFQSEHPHLLLQPIADYLEKVSQAEYIVIGNKDEIRYTHPVQDRIGKTMVGNDNDKALIDGLAYISKEEGTLGPAIRGKAPIFSNKGDIIGVVSVGFLLDEVHALSLTDQLFIWGAIFLVFIVGVFVATYLANYLKKVLHSLEPEEISSLFSEKEAILQSAKEGIIAFSYNNLVTPSLINNSAKNILQKAYRTSSLSEIHWKPFLSLEKEATDKTLYIKGIPLLVNKKQMSDNKGFVITFRKKNDIERLVYELQQMKSYTNTLRAQTHEFKNRMYTLLGLLQTKNYVHAEQFIQSLYTTEVSKNNIILSTIHDPHIQGLLLGKVAQANEKDIHFIIDDSSYLSPLKEKTSLSLLIIIGNILDNAIEAVNEEEKKEVFFYINDMGEELLIEVEDNGPIFPLDFQQALEEGISSKGKQRGYGLYLTAKELKKLEGEIFLEELSNSTLITVTIPKERSY